jgi:hypothetical protein
MIINDILFFALGVFASIAVRAILARHLERKETERIRLLDGSRL